MRTLPTAVIATLLAACAPGGDRAPAGDTAAAQVPALDTAATRPVAPAVLDTGNAGARPGTLSPVTPPSSGAPTQQRTVPRPRPAMQPAAQRPSPPTKPPGGTIFVPNTTHDSLRMAPPTPPPPPQR